MSGNALSGLQPLRALPSLVWVDVGGNRIEDYTPLDGLPGLTVAGPGERERRSVSVRRPGSAGRQ